MDNVAIHLRMMMHLDDTVAACSCSSNLVKNGPGNLTRSLIKTRGENLQSETEHRYRKDRVCQCE